MRKNFEIVLDQVNKIVESLKSVNSAAFFSLARIHERLLLVHTG
jgi:hypothetical protein